MSRGSAPGAERKSSVTLRRVRGLVGIFDPLRKRVLCPDTLAALFVFGTCAVLLGFEFRFFFVEQLIPWGDYAADDMRIVEAKYLGLWHGNYSRTGFYHPGPFYFQWMAIFELLFVDAFRVFASPQASHVFGLAFLHVLAYGLYLRLWLLWSGRVSVALVAVLVTFAVTVSGTDRNFLLLPWPPYMYLAGSLMTITGFIGLFVRGPTWLPLLVLGLAQLLHGHASFVGLIPIMIVVAVLTATAFGRISFQSLSLSRVYTFAATNPWPLIWSVAIIAVFLLPIVLQTVLVWPGEIPKYFSFAELPRSQTAVASAAYVLSLVPAYGVWTLALLIPRLRHVAGNRGEFTTELRFIAILLLTVGCSTAWFYAWKGIDTFEQHYMIFWLSPFVGAALAATVVLLLSLLPPGTHVAATAALFALLIVFLSRYPLIVWTDMRSATLVPAVLERLYKRVPPGMQIALRRELNTETWEHVWGDIVTLLAAMHRQGQHFLCVEPRSWHLLFHENYRCDDGDRIAETLYVSGKAVPGEVIARLPNSFVTSPQPPTIGLSLRGGELGPMLGDGWSTIEPWGVWSDQARAIIRVDASSLPPRFKIALSARLFPENQRVRISDEAGHSLATVSNANTGPILLDINRSNSPEQSHVALVFEVEKPTSPLELGKSRDHRRLGIGLESMSFQDCVQACGE